MDCTESRERLEAYLDHELDLPSVVAIDQHLAGCAACKAMFGEQAALQSAIRQHADYHSAPPALVARIRRRIGAVETRPARRRQWFQIGAAVAATAVLSWMAALQYAGRPQEETIAAQVVDGHARAVLTSHLIDVASADRHTVKPWLSSKLDFSPPVTDLAGEGFPLVGGRLDYLDNRTVATLVYRHRQHVVDLFIWPERAAPGGRSMRAFARQGYNVLRWSEGGMAFWAVSDLNIDEMKAFAGAVARQE